MDQQDRDHDLDIPPYASQRHPSRGFDPEMRRMALIAGGLAIVIVGVALIWDGVRPHLGPPPVIKPPAGPMRTVPKNPGGLQVPGANEQIMSGKVASGPPQLAPPPPPPDLSRLAEAAATAAKLSTPPPPPPRPPSAAASALPLPLPPPPSPPGPSPASSPPPQPELQLPVPNPVVIMPPRPAKPPPPPVATGSAEGFTVQLAALGSREQAEQAWRRLRARAPGLLASHTPAIVPGQVKGHTWYRLRLEGFQTRAAAVDLCERLKARHISCYIPR